MPSLDDLKKLAESSPQDPFPRYGLAMELKRQGRQAEAVAAFQALLERFPAYVPGHQQLGLALAAAGKLAEAREAYLVGIDAAEKSGNRHAADEMRSALNMLG